MTQLDASTIPENAPAKPAPWYLTGDGFILVYWFSKAFILENGFIPVNLIDSFHGGPSVVMLVNYHHSAVGPYQELLFIPGRFTYHGRRLSSITKIYVSTWASVVNGRRNWAIPKEKANVTWQTDDKMEHIHLTHDGHPFASFLLNTWGPAVPVTSALVPAGWQTLLQPDHTQKILFTQLQAIGRVSIARLLKIHIDSAYFPDLTQGHLLGAGKVVYFRMTFPVASTSL